MNILVLDVGTSSMRGTLMDAAARVLFSKQIKYQPTYGPEGLVEQAPSDWQNAMERLCLLAGQAGEIHAIALTSQRSSLIPADADGNPLTPAIMWQDTRNRALCDSLKSREDQVRAICGTGINTVFSGGKMAWLRENLPEVYEKAAHLFVIPDYLIYRMTGEVKTDHTYGSRSMLMDLCRGDWSEELLALFGVDREKLGQLVPPASIVGRTTAAFSETTGLAAGIPVITCGGDQQCGALGQGVFREGQVSVILGTGAYLIAPVSRIPEPLRPGILCNASAVPGQYILESAVLTCGAALDWFLRELGGDVTAVGEALRVSPPGANGVLALPYFQGRADPDWNSGARAGFFGITLSTTRQDLLRALLEAICLEIRGSLTRLCPDREPDAVHLSGGMSRSPELCQLLADVTGIPVVCTDDSDATTRGAWMSAARCLGLYADWDGAWSAARPDAARTFSPEPGLRAFYEKLSAQLQRLYAATK